MTLDLRNEFFVDLTSLADSQNSERSPTLIDSIHNAKPADAVFPAAFQLSQERNAARRVCAEEAKSRFDPPLEVRRKMADDVCNVRRDIKLKAAHYRARGFLGGISGSPNMSSNDTPFFGVA